ncbi:MAG: MerR family transcriptional regulator [Chitinophagales bacterium]|nr:MerR family transcriptional regulator [Chitinophagales bacterium]
MGDQQSFPYNDQELKKLYYSIGEVAEQLKVAPSLIRYWESEFPEIHPRKNKRGNRLFTSDDIHTLRLVYHLTKEKGFTIEGARNQLKISKKKIDQQLSVLDRLKGIREFLSEMKDQL